MKGSSVFLIDQNLLPFDFRVLELRTCADTCRAIRTMAVRGAGAIGAAAGFAMAQAFLEATGDLEAYVDRARKEIESTRPTANPLFAAVKKVHEAASASRDRAKAALTEAQRLADEDVEGCKKIGEIGEKLIKAGAGVLTHCNAGWLAFVDHGTALSPVYAARGKGKELFVYVDETRPRMQGARLTAWELSNEGVPHVIIPDNAAAHLMSLGKIDCVLVGADRIARNGDVANKIGTLEKAICAKRYGMPFYVCATSSAIDPACRSGSDIAIEERDQDEVLYQTGVDEKGERRKVLLACPGSGAANPAFDVTPAELITNIITEKGIVRPDAKSLIPLAE